MTDKTERFSELSPAEEKINDEASKKLWAEMQDETMNNFFNERRGNMEKHLDFFGDKIESFEMGWIVSFSKFMYYLGHPTYNLEMECFVKYLDLPEILKDYGSKETGSDIIDSMEFVEGDR